MWQNIVNIGQTVSNNKLSKILGSLCKEHKLDKGAMHRVLKGKQSNHKNWRLFHER